VQISSGIASVIKPHLVTSVNLKGLVSDKPQVASSNNYRTQTDDDITELDMLFSLGDANHSAVADPQTNSIRIQPGEVKNIGSVDGYPINVYYDADGNLNTNFAIMINVNDPLDSPRTQLALSIQGRYTAAQMQEAESLIWKFQMLHCVDNGTFSVENYNAASLSQGGLSTPDFLTSLGIDVSKPFSFNGKSFTLDAQGNLQAAMTASRLTIPELSVES
jgi:hypothetical protein